MHDPFWYNKIWNLDIKTSSWVEDTEHQVDFIIKTLELKGNERILDLACGFGRHALALARRGYQCVGVDITEAYVKDATKHAQAEGLSAQFIHADIRDITFESEFDVVLNLADGAIDYLEIDEENLKIFDGIARALKPGGKHFMDVCNAEHAALYFPKRHWEAGEYEIALAAFDWIPETRRMLYGGGSIPLGKTAKKPKVVPKNPTRLYSRQELCNILAARGMEIIAAYSNYYGKPDTSKELQLMVYSRKR